MSHCQSRRLPAQALQLATLYELEDQPKDGFQGRGLASHVGVVGVGAIGWCCWCLIKP